MASTAAMNTGCDVDRQLFKLFQLQDLLEIFPPARVHAQTRLGLELGRVHACAPRHTSRLVVRLQSGWQNFLALLG